MNILIIGGTGFFGSYLKSFLSKNHSIDYTYANQFSEHGIKYLAGQTNLSDVIQKKYDLVINNINPEHLSYMETVSAVNDVIFYCNRTKARLIHISSVSALNKNRNANSYNLKKAFAEDLIITEMASNNYSILRFTQLFDAAGLSRKSQAGLYYLLDCIKFNKQISVFANQNECFRNYTPVEIALKFIDAIIKYDLKGIYNAHFDSFTFSFSDLMETLTNLNGNYNSKELIIAGDKIGQSYYIEKQSDELISKITVEDDLVAYFEKAYKMI